MLFKSYRNLYNKVIKLAKRKYFESELLKNQSNLKKSWSLINQAINRKPKNKSHLISFLTVNNAIITDPLEMANNLNSFFTSAPGQIVSEILQPILQDQAVDQDDNIQDPPLFSFSSLELTETEFINAINMLEPKKSLDFNNLSMQFLKNFTSELTKPLLHVFQKSLSRGVVPSQLKLAKIVPIFKSGDAASMDNYRPIALLSNFSKILEKIVYLRLSSFLETNNL